VHRYVRILGSQAADVLFTLRAAAAHLSEICRPAGGMRYVGLPEAALRLALPQVESVAPWKISDSVVLFVGGVLVGGASFLLFQGSTARRTRVAVAAVAACALLCCAALATFGNVNQAISLVDEVDGLELNAYLTPNDVEEFQKVFTFLPFVYRGRRNFRLACRLYTEDGAAFALQDALTTCPILVNQSSLN